MNIFYVTEYYPFYAAKVVHEIATRLISHGCSVTVLTSNVEISKRTRIPSCEEYIKNVRVIRFDAFPLTVSSTDYIVYNCLKLGSLLTRLKNEIGLCDVLHLHCGHGTLNLLSSIFRGIFNKNLNLIYTSHGIPGQYPSLILKIGSGAARAFTKQLIVKRSKFVTTVGLQDIRYWMNQGVSREKLRHIPNGVDTRFFRHSAKLRKDFREEHGFYEDQIVILFFAQLRKAKGIDLLLQAVPKLVSANSNVRFLIAGTGPMAEFVKLYIQKRRLEQYVNVLSSYLAEEDLPYLFNGCDIYVLPSYIEGMPLSLMEAMACGKPVIATSVGDVPHLVKNGVNGFLINPGDVDVLAKSIKTLAADSKLIDKMGRMNIAKMRNYDWSKIAERYYSLYLEAMNIKHQV